MRLTQPARQDAEREPERPRPAPHRLDVLALQRSAGNAAVARMLQRVTITDEDGVELQQATTADLFDGLTPRVRRTFARLPVNLQQGFARLPQPVQQRLLLLEEDQQEAVLRLPGPLLGTLLAQAAAPVPMLEAQNQLVPAGPVRDHKEPKLPGGLLDFLHGLGPDLPLVPVHQPSGNDPLLQAGRDFLEAGGAEADVRWALRSCRGETAMAKQVLRFLLDYIGSPLLDQAKLELERARGDQRVARVKLAAVKRMHAEQAERAEASAQSNYEIEKAELDVQKELDEVPLRKAAQKRPKRRAPRNAKPKAPVKSPLQVHAEKYEALDAGLEATREQRASEGAERNLGALLVLTGQQDAEQVEVLLHATRGDVHLLTRLAPTLKAAGAEADVLATALVESGTPETLAPRCRELLAARKATAATAVTVAQFMFDVPAAEAQDWARRNGHGIHGLKAEMQFLATHRKFAATAVCALDELGLIGAEDLVPVLHLGAPLAWCIANLTGADRKTALQTIKNHPHECVPLHQVLLRNPPGGAKHKSNAALMDAIKKYTGAKYDTAHQHFVVTAACNDATFTQILDLMHVGHTLQTALHWLAQAEVAVPQGVQVSGWVSLNPGNMVRYPMAFTKGGYHTDQLCLKHYEEFVHSADLNGVVPVARMQNYFADLVAGCDAAFALYKQEKPKKEDHASYRGKPTGRAEWRIKIKNGSSGPEIFHVDSHYETSYWTRNNA